MSRAEPTAEEKAAGTALLKNLREDGYPITHEDFDDRPDLRFLINGEAFGCEIVGLVPEDMQQAMRTFSTVMYRRGADVAKITIPIEPDEWMKTTIERKWAKVQKYPRTLFTKELSLLVHPPYLGPSDPVEYDREEFVLGVRYGQAVANHGFANVFYWSGKRLFAFNDRGGPPSLKTYPFDLSEGYPAYIMWIMSAGKEGLRERFENRSIPLALPAEHTKHIRPMDPNFKKLSPFEMKGDFRFQMYFHQEQPGKKLHIFLPAPEAQEESKV
jgi:hypothetical protein